MRKKGAEAVTPEEISYVLGAYSKPAPENSPLFSQHQAAGNQKSNGYINFSPTLTSGKPSVAFPLPIVELKKRFFKLLDNDKQLDEARKKEIKALNDDAFYNFILGMYTKNNGAPKSTGSDSSASGSNAPTPSSQGSDENRTDRAFRADVMDVVVDTMADDNAKVRAYLNESARGLLVDELIQAHEDFAAIDETKTKIAETLVELDQFSNKEIHKKENEPIRKNMIEAFKKTLTPKSPENNRNAADEERAQALQPVTQKQFESLYDNCHRLGEPVDARALNLSGVDITAENCANNKKSDFSQSKMDGATVAVIDTSKKGERVPAVRNNVDGAQFTAATASTIKLQDKKSNTTIEISPQKFNELLDARYAELRKQQYFAPAQHAMNAINTKYSDATEFEKAMAKMQYAGYAASHAITTSTTQSALCEITHELALTQRLGLRGLYEKTKDLSDRKLLIKFCEWYDSNRNETPETVTNKFYALARTQQREEAGYFRFFRSKLEDNNHTTLLLSIKQTIQLGTGRGIDEVMPTDEPSAQEHKSNKSNKSNSGNNPTNNLGFF